MRIQNKALSIQFCFFLIFAFAHLESLAQRPDSVIQSNTNLDQLLHAIKNESLTFEFPDRTFRRSGDSKSYVSDTHQAKVNYRITPLGLQAMFTSFKDRYFIETERTFLGGDEIRVEGQRAFIMKFEELQGENKGFVNWVLMFGDQSITYSASCSYPKEKDKELGGKIQWMLENVKIKD